MPNPGIVVHINNTYTVPFKGPTVDNANQGSQTIKLSLRAVDLNFFRNPQTSVAEPEPVGAKVFWMEPDPI